MPAAMPDPQRTLAKEVSFSGRGLHTGTAVTVRATAAPAGAGIVFIRTDLPHKPTIPVSAGQILDIDKTVRRTTLCKDGVEVQTVEHFMAALWGAGLDNAYVEITGHELPGMDGSALPFYQALAAAGAVEQAAPRRYLTVREPIHVEDGDASITVLPDRGFQASYLLSYPHPMLKSQFVSYQMNGAAGAGFSDQVAPARTFCLKEEAEALRAAGYGKGADTTNTLVVDAKGVLDNTLRFEDEFARHKLLDLLGDLYLLGAHLRGRVMAVKSGHPLNAKLVLKLTQALDQWRLGSLQSGASEVMVGPQLDITQIQKILPHRQPFLMVDRIIELSDTRAVGIKNVTINDGFFRGHFPERPVMPGVLMVEALAQVGGIILLNKQEHLGKYAYFVSVDKVRFRKVVVPGDTLVLEAELGKVRSRTFQVTARALVDGKVVCEGELMFALAD